MADPALLTFGIGLAILAVFGGLAYALDQSVIPAYIVAGLLVGPYGPTIGGVSLSIVPNTAVLGTLADLGVILLLFFLGVEFDPRSLLSRPRRLPPRLDARYRPACLPRVQGAEW
ncbi:MAG: cation:proton antiporter [Halanaeroarchaeum sp.]